jgi:RNA polymerase sigma factor (sigma-70 family)
LIEAWREVERVQGLEDPHRKRRLRKMFLHNLLDAIDHESCGKCDFRREQSLEAAAEESSCRVRAALALEETPPLDRLVQEEERLRILEALSRVEPRAREVLILKKYHGKKLREIAEDLDCTIGVVAGLHARGLGQLQGARSSSGTRHRNTTGRDSPRAVLRRRAMKVARKNHGSNCREPVVEE